MSYKFNAIIKNHEDKDATFVEIPFDVEKEFGAKRVKVKAYFDGAEYRGSIVKMGMPCYILGITKELRNKISKGPGDTILVEIDKDEEERIIELPEDFKNELEKNVKALEFYGGLSFSNQRKYFQWIASAKKAETREKRIQEAIAKLEGGLKI